MFLEKGRESFEIDSRPFVIILPKKFYFAFELVVFFYSNKMLLLQEQTSYLEDERRYYPCQEGGVSSGKSCPLPTARLALDCGNRGNTREVQEHEEQETVGGERSLG